MLLWLIDGLLWILEALVWSAGTVLGRPGQRRGAGPRGAASSPPAS